MMAFFAIVKRELVSILRERTILIAILLQLFIASFSSALLSGMLALYDPDTIAQYGGANIHVGVVNQTVDWEEAIVFSELISNQGLKSSYYSSLDEAKIAFSQGQIQAIAVIPAEGKVYEMTLILPVSQVESSLIRLAIQEPLKQYENHLREKRGVALRYADLKGSPNTSFEFIYSILLPILMFFPAFVAGGVVIDSISEEVEGKTLPTLLSAPLSINQVVGAKIVSALIPAGIQVLAWLGLLRLNGVVVQNAGWVVFLALLLAGILSVVAGLMVVIFKDRERSQFVFSLFILAASGAVVLIGLSPVKMVARFSVGDAATSGWDLLPFLAILAVFGLLLSRFTRRLKMT